MSQIPSSLNTTRNLISCIGTPRAHDIPLRKTVNRGDLFAHTAFELDRLNEGIDS